MSVCHTRTKPTDALDGQGRSYREGWSKAHDQVLPGQEGGLRIETALVAMEANVADKPVIVLCETIKFTERIALDSIVHKEIAPGVELVIPGGSLEKWGDIKKLWLCNPIYTIYCTNSELTNSFYLEYVIYFGEFRCKI